MEVYDITSRNPSMPVLAHEVLNGKAFPDKKMKLSLGYLRRAHENKTYEQARREYKESLEAWRKSCEQKILQIASHVTTTAYPTLAPASDEVSLASKRAREQVLDELTRTFSVEELEALVARKRIAV